MIRIPQMREAAPHFTKDMKSKPEDPTAVLCADTSVTEMGPVAAASMPSRTLIRLAIFRPKSGESSKPEARSSAKEPLSPGTVAATWTDPAFNSSNTPLGSMSPPASVAIDHWSVLLNSANSDPFRRLKSKCWIVMER